MTQGENINQKPDKNLMIASKILNRNSSLQNLNSDNDLYSNPNNNVIEINNENKNNHVFNPTSSITPYILLIALSVHGVFEGIALGVMNTVKECSILFSAIILHKWAAAFALGISFYKSGTEKDLFIKMILLFTSFGPLGIIIGMIFSDAGNLIKGVTSPECHHHLLRRGKEDDKYMQIELGILSSYIKYDIQDNNGNSFLTEMTFKNGKYSGIIKMLNNTDLKLSFCKNESIFYKAKQESLNYIFKFKTKADDDFTNYILENNNVSSEYEENQNSVVLNIPKVLYQNGSKTIAAPGVYYIRLYPNLTLDTKDNLSTISFISYYAYGTYNYTIYENETNTDNISYTLNNFPKDQDYIVSII